ncbi:MAG: rhomboid family intramembrane serine protease [Cytophagales bacterium]|nr:rhomboid family intramembrane serine protease [Armatimonadota bacterium]
MAIGPIGILVLLVLLAALLVPLIPVRRRRRGGMEGFPFVTVGLLVINLVLFAGNSQRGGLEEAVAMHWGLIPDQASLLTLFTYMFLHGSWAHVLGNLLGLWLFGPHVEEALGKVEYLLFYLGAGIAGGLMHVVVADIFLPAAQSQPLVGASGAIFGVLGLFAVRFWRTRMRVLLFFNVPAVWAVGLFALLQFFAGLHSLADGGATTNTANWAHVGGFAFGMLIAVPLRMREDSRAEYSLEDAQKAQAMGQFDISAAYYRQTLSATPNNADAHRALAQVCVQLRQGEAAHRHYLEALRLYIKAENARAAAGTYGDALTSFEVFPLGPRLLQRVASACEEAQAYPLALSALSELCRDHPQTPEGEMGLLRLGRLHLAKLNQPQNAAGIFGEFLRMYPDSAWKRHAEQLLRDSSQTLTPLPPAATTPRQG